jgi:hypothetical protein
MKLINIIPGLLVLTLFYSCTKEEPLTNINDNTTDVLLLSQVLIDNQPSFEYTYNTSSLVNEEKSMYDLSVNNYNGNNQLVSTVYYVNYSILSNDPEVANLAMNQTVWVSPDDANKSGTLTYEYNSKGLLIKTTYAPVTGSTEVSEFSYNSKNRISSQILMWDDIKTGYISYAYDDYGNLIEEYLYNIESSGVADLAISKFYEYDGKINPYKSMIPGSRLPGIYTNKNNITKETYTVYAAQGKGTDNLQVTQNTYKYNSQGYPISKNGNVKYVYN